MSKEVILTGIRSNDEPTLGNLLGAFLPMVKMQQAYSGKYQLNMFVPDLHSFTTPVDHSSLYENTIRNLKYFLAAGLDIAESSTFIYRQSHIAAHSELSWILDCFTGFGEASRMVEFKDKGTQLGVERVSVGLFNYPVLMAADILLYDAKWIPVGEDQRQHLELTRTLAIRLNNKFGDLFVVPESLEKQMKFLGLEVPIRIRSLRNPDKKMSKSIDDPAGTILLSDSPKNAATKVMSATTDSVGTISFDWDRQPGISNLLQILSIITAQKQSDVNKQWEGKSSYGELKIEVASQVDNLLTSFQAKLVSIDTDQLLQKLESDEATMSEVAQDKIAKVQKAVGLRK